jgi:hypothetical protein
LLVHTGKIAADKRQHAAVLLKADISDPGGGWMDEKISEALSISIRTASVYPF